MSIEPTSSSSDYEEIDDFHDDKYRQLLHEETNLHSLIFNEGKYMSVLRGVTFKHYLTKIEKNTQQAALIMGLRIQTKGKVSAEAGVSFKWGGEDNGSVSGYVSGSASDDSGNKAEVEVTVNDDGSGEATVSVSHEED